MRSFMQTKRRKLGELTIEEPLLDAEGQARQRELNERALLEYTEKRTLSSETLREHVEQYEKDIRKHLIH